MARKAVESVALRNLSLEWVHSILTDLPISFPARQLFLHLSLHRKLLGRTFRRLLHVKTSEWYENESKKQGKSKIEVWLNRVFPARAMTDKFCMRVILGTLPGPLTRFSSLRSDGPGYRASRFLSKARNVSVNRSLNGGRCLSSNKHLLLRNRQR